MKAYATASTAPLSVAVLPRTLFDIAPSLRSDLWLLIHKAYFGATRPPQPFVPFVFFVVAKNTWCFEQKVLAFWGGIVP